MTFNGMGLQKKLDPSLDFTAQTKAAEVTAVVHITGLADAPQIELTSTPELPQDEILARLLFGEPAAQLTALQLVQTGAALGEPARWRRWFQLQPGRQDPEGVGIGSFVGGRRLERLRIVCFQLSRAPAPVLKQGVTCPAGCMWA